MEIEGEYVAGDLELVLVLDDDGLGGLLAEAVDGGGEGAPGAVGGGPACGAVEDDPAVAAEDDAEVVLGDRGGVERDVALGQAAAGELGAGPLADEDAG
jgi:hypothetical protein